MAAKAKGYHELLGHFRRVRAYMQHFYIYGFYTREEFEGGSARSYDNERRRLEGWMGEYYGFRMTKSGKANFISFDSRSVRRNPLYRALKSKAFMPSQNFLTDRPCSSSGRYPPCAQYQPAMLEPVDSSTRMA